MRILVTGASGFIGSAVVPALTDRAYEVRALTRAETFNEHAFSACDVVVHLANLAHASVTPKLLWQVNVEGTLRIAQSAAATGVRRLIYLSSVKVSGEETRGRAYNGSESPAPADHYARAKLAAEEALAQIAARSKLEVVVLRPPLVYGPHVKANFLSLLRGIEKGWPLPFASIANRRSLVYVGNLADAIVRCVEHEAAPGRTFMVSDGEAVSTPDLCRALAEALGRSARFFPCPPALLEVIPALKKLTRSLEVDDSSLRHQLNWRPPYSFEEGLRVTAAWYQGR